MITIYTMAYNEEVFLQYMIDHYKSKFPNCHIVVYDNESTDNTRQIALKNNCEVFSFQTNGKIDDIKIRDLKNNCWKNSKTDWVLICDVDELLNIDANQLQNEMSFGTTIIRSEGWNLVNMEDNYDFANMKYGTRCPPYDKNYLFNKSLIKEINYVCGAHRANPIGNVKYSENIYRLYHYKCLNENYLVSRFRLTAKRLSQENIARGMGIYWLEDNEDIIRGGYRGGKAAAIKLID